MNDSKSASLVLVVGAAGVAYWWWSLNSGKLAPPATPDAPTGAPGKRPTKSPQASSGPITGRWKAPAKVIDPGGKSFPWPIQEMLKAWAKKPRPGWPSRG
jgi:hypothetical protein